MTTDFIIKDWAICNLKIVNQNRFLVSKISENDFPFCKVSPFIIYDATLFGAHTKMGV